MTADAADDERDGAAHPVAPSEAEPGSAPGVSHESPSARPQTEWTASDRRGPLSAATEDEDVERFVPGSEMDAEGTPDATRSPAETSGETTDAPVAGTVHDDPGELHRQEAAEGAAAPDAATSEARVADKPAPAARGSSPLALVSGLVLGAVIGAGSAALVYWQAPQLFGRDTGGGDRLASLSSRVDALEKRPGAAAPVQGDLRKQLSALQGQTSDLEGKVKALADRSASVPASASGPGAAAGASDAAVAAKVAALQAQVDALGKAPQPAGADKLSEREQQLEGKIGGVETTASDARKQVAAAQSQLDALRGQQKGLEDKLGSLQAAVGAAQKDAASAQSGLGAVQTQQKDLEGRVGAPALAVVADSLVEQIEAGKPYARQVDALVTLGADPAKVAVLKQEAGTGVPSAQTLLARFEPLADKIAATGSKEPHGAGFVQQLRHGLFGLVSVRRTDETTGSDLPSRIARIKADLAHNDVAGAFAAWNALPADAKQVSQDWGALTKTTVEASAAARDLRTDAIGALGGKRS